MTLLPNGTPGVFEAIGLFYPDTFNRSREKDEFACALFEEAPMAIILVDAETRIIADLNTAAASLIGGAKEEIIGRQCEDFIFPAEVEESPRTGTGGNSVYATQNTTPAFGPSVTVLNSTVPLVLKGRPHLLEYYVDISERKKVEGKLTAENRELKILNGQLRGALLEARQSVRDSLASCRMRNGPRANLGHELRTPLNAILGLSELILDRQFGDLTDPQEKYLGEVVQSARHLLSLINDLLGLDKNEVGEL